MPAARKALDSTVTQLIAQLDRKIISARAGVEKAQAELARLEAEREALATALNMIQRGPQPPSSDRPWPELSRSDAVARILEQKGGALSPRDISVVLAERGRHGDEPAAVSAALNYLAKKGRASSPGPGLWQAGPGDRSGPGLIPAPDEPPGDHSQVGNPAPVYPLETDYYEIGPAAQREPKSGTTSEAPGPEHPSG